MSSRRPRLQGQAAIARYLDRDTRTIRRWIKTRALPVTLRGGTYIADPVKLDAWERPVV